MSDMNEGIFNKSKSKDVLAKAIKKLSDTELLSLFKSKDQTKYPRSLVVAAIKRRHLAQSGTIYEDKEINYGYQRRTTKKPNECSTV